MGQTLFYRTLNKLEHHFLNIEQTRTSSPIGDRTRTPYFWLQTNKHQSLNLKGLSLDRFTKILIELTWTSFFQTLNELEHVHLLMIELKHLNFGFKQMDIEYEI